jgi:hypothetical protein
VASKTEVRLPREHSSRAFVYSPARSAKTLRAAAAPASSTRRESRQLFQPWQALALGYYDKLGPCRYPANFHAAMLAPIRLYLGVRDEKGEIEEIEDSKGILSRLEDPGGGHASLLSNYAILRFLAGESYLLNTADEDDPDGERFEIVSPLELRLNTDGKNYQRIRAPGLSPVELISADEDDLDMLELGEARVWRFHRRHPTYSDWADSPVRSVLHLYEELELLHLEAKSQLRSRIARAGILFIDGRITFTLAGPGDPDEAEPEGVADEDPEEDELLDALIEAVIAAISDPDSPAAHAPVIARVENQTGLPLKDLIHHWMHDIDENFPSTERIEKLHGWIAQGIDLPPEISLGFSDSNHWNAWLVDEQAWEAHGKPDAVAFCQDITEAYVRRKAIAESLEDAENVICWFDPAEVTTDPDRSKNARDLYRDGELSGETYRDVLGFAKETDEPSDEERRRHAAFKLRDTSLLPGAEIAPAEETNEDIVRSEPADGEPEAEEDTPFAASTNGRLEDALRGAAEFGLYRSRELAGARLLGLRRSCEECFEGAGAVPKERIAAYLGEEKVRELISETELELVKDGCEIFLAIAERLGVDPELARELGALIESHAALTLYDDEPPPVPLP